MALSGSHTEVVVRHWRRCGEELDTAETKTDEVVNHFLAIEPAAVATILDAKTGPEGVALKKAVSFLSAQETLRGGEHRMREMRSHLHANICSRLAKSCVVECAKKPTPRSQAD